MKKNRLLKTGTVLGLLCVAFSATVFGEPPVKYSQVEFDSLLVPPRRLGELGITLDHEDIWNKRTYSLTVSQYDLQALRTENFPFTVLIDDYAAFLENRNIREAAAAKAAAAAPSAMPPPVHFKQGTMGGMLTFAEIVREIDSMRTLYPALVSAKIQIGTSLEGRAMYAIRISDNPSVDENEPKLFYNGLMHAREPMSMMNLIYFAWHLLENYASDPGIRSLVDNLEIFILPCTNPDGYEYNRSTNPNGGGLWRKNRSVNAGGTRGVDINRNFSVFWGDNSGSSGTSSADNYRGPSAFSEPETQVLRSFHQARQFDIMINIHSYMNKVITPYGNGSYTSNRTEYERIAREMTRVNGWQYGLSTATVGYAATGVEIDWAHDLVGEYAFAAEVGATSDGFWPPASRISAVALSALDMNLALAREALSTVGGISMPGKKITPQFHADANSASGRLNFTYQLTENKDSWYLTVHDLQGRQNRRYPLSPNANRIALSRSGFHGPLILLDVSACGETGCRSIYREKVMLGGGF